MIHDSATATSAHPYDALKPDTILDAMEEAGFAVSGRLFALNSYENRVYQVGLDEGAPVIAKFYRPGRWTEAAIREEHAITLEFLEADIPVVAPLVMPRETLSASMANSCLRCFLSEAARHRTSA